MKKSVSILALLLAFVLVFSACSSDNNNNNGNTGNNEQTEDLGNSNQENPGQTEEPGDTNDADQEGNEDTEEPGTEDDGVKTELDEIIDQIKNAVEQRPTMELDAESVEEWYHFDPAMLEDFAIHLPVFNISTNEVAVLKVLDEKDIPTVEAGIKQRAEDVQKQFEQYLQDQYENAKNYKLVVNGPYILFVIDDPDTAEAMVQVFEDYMASK